MACAAAPVSATEQQPVASPNAFVCPAAPRN